MTHKDGKCPMGPNKNKTKKFEAEMENLRVSLVQTRRSCPLGFLVQLALVRMSSVQASPGAGAFV